MRGLPLLVAPVFAICAVCALAGCTTVSAPPPGPSAPPPAAPERPQDVRVLPPPAHHMLATAHPHPSPPRARRDRHRDTAAAPAPPPAAHHRAPRTHVPGRVPLPAEPDVCGLGETYGGWAPGSQASTICREAYGP